MTCLDCHSEVTQYPKNLVAQKELDIHLLRKVPSAFASLSMTIVEKY
jgi:hypothetical protein